MRSLEPWAAASRWCVIVLLTQPARPSSLLLTLISPVWSGHSLHRNWALCDWLTVTGSLVGEISWRSELKISRCCPAQNIRSIVNFNWNFLCSELILTGQRFWVPSLGMYLFSPIFLEETTWFLTDLRIPDLHIYIYVPVCSMSKKMNILKVRTPPLAVNCQTWSI